MNFKKSSQLRWMIKLNLTTWVSSLQPGRDRGLSSKTIIEMDLLHPWPPPFPRRLRPYSKARFKLNNSSVTSRLKILRITLTLILWENWGNFKEFKICLPRSSKLSKLILTSEALKKVWANLGKARISMNKLLRCKQNKMDLILKAKIRLLKEAAEESTEEIDKNMNIT